MEISIMALKRETRYCHGKAREAGVVREQPNDAAAGVFDGYAGGDLRGASENAKRLCEPRTNTE